MTRKHENLKGKATPHFKKIKNKSITIIKLTKITQNYKQYQDIFLPFYLVNQK